MHKLSEEYPDYFEELFSNANHRSSLELNLKEEAIINYKNKNSIVNSQKFV